MDRKELFEKHSYGITQTYSSRHPNIMTFEKFKAALDEYHKSFPVELPVKPEIAEWISVKDKLPELGEKVLIELDDDFVTLIGRLHSNGWSVFYSDGECLVGDPHESSQVTHWMPLPEPPKR